ncbi:MAG: hypothetical protein KC646_03750 [Candidatus Cloacimonetes bacterium]|nr:hypothetical protein [Candidatus Cloacimonadota bacterium]
MLNQGKALEVVNQFYSENVSIYENDNILATSREESFNKQEPYIRVLVKLMEK